MENTTLTLSRDERYELRQMVQAQCAEHPNADPTALEIIDTLAKPAHYGQPAFTESQLTRLAELLEDAARYAPRGSSFRTLARSLTPRVDALRTVALSCAMAA